MTILGLAAAIPAVLAAQLCAHRLAGCRTALADVSAAVLRCAARDLDRRRAPFRRAAE